MGTTGFWVTMSERPEYNSKIKLMSAFAPVAYTEHMISPIRHIAPFDSEIEVIQDSLLSANIHFIKLITSLFVSVALVHVWSPRISSIFEIYGVFRTKCMPSKQHHEGIVQ